MMAWITAWACIMIWTALLSIKNAIEELKDEMRYHRSVQPDPEIKVFYEKM